MKFTSFLCQETMKVPTNIRASEMVTRTLRHVDLKGFRVEFPKVKEVKGVF